MTSVTRSRGPILALLGLAALLMFAALASAMTSDSLEAGDVVVREGEVAVFDIALPRSYDFAVRYSFTTRDASAKAGSDYEAKQGHAVWPAGKKYAEVRIKTLKDNVEDNDHFELVLSDPEMQRSVWGGPLQWMNKPSRGIASELPERKTIRAQIRNVANPGKGRF